MSYGELKSVVNAALAARKARPSPQELREVVAKFRLIYPDVDDDEAERLARHLEEIYIVVIEIESIVQSPGHRQWLPGRQAAADFEPYYWDRYLKLLRSVDFPAPVLDRMDEVTNRIVGLLADPRASEKWDRRGLVLGHVQSGKTANYIGTVCKAADAGYKLIVIIAGVHNNLRNQTQERVDEGFVGRDSTSFLNGGTSRWVGVGHFDKRRRPVTLTNAVRDFDSATASAVGLDLRTLSDPAVLVIKKNARTLRNLIEWLKEHGTGDAAFDVPFLLIDDEADNASINIAADRNRVARINGLIRELLNVFPRSCYLAYTATPFANILIDPDVLHSEYGKDLFPKDFIVSLEPPSNYVGPSRVFLQDDIDAVREIGDNEGILPAKHKRDFDLKGLPPSLENAVRAFVIARAIRLHRGESSAHNSMLINVTPWMDVQGSVRRLVKDLVDSIRAHVRVNGAKPADEAELDQEISALRAVWEAEFSGAAAWGDVFPLLLNAVGPVEVLEINSRSTASLDYRRYEGGRTVIAVGGYALSRGLTLEGLTVSYYLRNTQTYDTMMQMGRWFGYRRGYEDLVRIWMTAEARGWFEHVAEAVEQLRAEVKLMEDANLTPDEFGLRVRSHPTALEITARNKMGTGQEVVVQVGLGNSFIETTALSRDNTKVARNVATAEELAREVCKSGELEHTSWGYLGRGVPVELILKFIGDFQNDPVSIHTDSKLVADYIQRNRRIGLEAWDVLFAGIKNANIIDGVERSDHGRTLGDQRQINFQYRAVGSRTDSSCWRVGNRQRVASRGVEAAGLPQEKVKALKAGFEGKRKSIPDHLYRAERTAPLLIVHLLDLVDDQKRLQAGPLVAWSASFPRLSREEKQIAYLVNARWLQMREPAPDDIGDEYQEDDE